LQWSAESGRSTRVMSGGAPFSVLVVEDDASVRHLVSRVLEARGMRPTTVGNALEALALLSSSVFTAVLLDKNLPQMSGLELAQKIRESWPELPIVLMTAFPESGMLSKAPIDGYLPKPFRHLDDVPRGLELAVERRARQVEVSKLQSRLSTVQDALRLVPKPSPSGPGSR
jgi:CheY-like chemotaxis protein